MTNIVLVRHGETVWHADNRYAGRTDVALTDLGREQAQRLATWAAEAQLDAIWCSPLARARDTAQIAAGATGCSPRVDDRLVELDFGRGEGLTSADMQREFPDALADFRADPVRHHLPGGEDPRAAVERALSCLREIASEHPSGRVLVVAHTTLLRLTLCRLIGVSLSDYRRLFPFVRNGAITEIAFGAEHTSLLQFNASLDAVTPAGGDGSVAPVPSAHAH
ncbi:MAG: Alpha-ribazole-5'-phosphate phosphatase [uncultured Solirubrobacteraceae bacterium]|uniref:Alpha-ribazole-5'-phosphate phosphatase n=1 Tax=uncultured Solirubrobacteraceae bacterium TaxID=1162706 RepID=A0A6J4RYZ8_9ACTN|nr:MAG: Alpha-ribazole-5'-phosphate phosphatase [uncultured Solirubrobacteraceae bacterium]